MTTSDTAIAFDHVEKHFRVFSSPLHRVKEALHPTGKIYHTPLPVLRDVSFRVPQGQAVLGILHLAVTALSYCAGVVDLDAGFAESILRPGDGHAGPLATCAGGGAGLANQIDGSLKSDGGVA